MNPSLCARPMLFQNEDGDSGQLFEEHAFWSATTFVILRHS